MLSFAVSLHLIDSACKIAPHRQRLQTAGQSKNRKRVHSSMYSSLRTNLPRHIMAYTDLPFTLNATDSSDDRLYCSHQEASL